MKKIIWTLGSKLLLFTAVFIFQQCSKGDDGDDGYGSTTEPLVITVTASNFNTNFNENPTDGESVGTIQAITNSGSVRFSIVSQSDSGAISVNATTGQISVADASLFDYESRMVITAVVRVSSGSVSEDITVTINLVDIVEVDVSTLTLWEGTPITFTKDNGADPTQSENQDRISDNVWLTRGDVGILFNAFSESAASNGSSPAGTEWAQGTFDDLETIEFTNFRAACPGEKPKNVVGIPMVMHLIQDDVYIEIIITSWAQGKVGGFTYERSTP